MKCKSLSIFLSALAVIVGSVACGQPARPELVFTPDKLPEAIVGSAYNVEIVITQNETPVGGFTIPDGSLPKGLTFEFVQNENKARISGTPEEAGTFKFKASVWCFGTNVSGQSGEKEYTLVVK